LLNPPLPLFLANITLDPASVPAKTAPATTTCELETATDNAKISQSPKSAFIYPY